MPDDKSQADAATEDFDDPESDPYAAQDDGEDDEPVVDHGSQLGDESDQDSTADDRHAKLVDDGAPQEDGDEPTPTGEIGKEPSVKPARPGRVADKPPVADETPDGFDEVDLIRAEALGIDRADALKMSPVGLRHTVRVLQSRAVPQQAGQPQQTRQQGNNGSGSQQQRPFEVRAATVELPDDDIGVEPVVSQAIKGVNTHYGERVSAVEYVVGELVKEFLRRDSDTKSGDLDQFVAGLGEAWKDKFGDGDSAELDPKSAHYRNREALFREREQLETLYRSVPGRKPPKQDVILNKALASLFGTDIKAKARSELSRDLSKHASRMTRRPTHREEVGRSPRATAVAAVADKMRDFGVDVIEGEIDDPALD